MKLLFSKTAYQKGKQCLKALYLYKHHYKLRDPLPEERRQRFEIGHQIGKIAHGLFPGGIDLSPAGPLQPEKSAKRTTEVLEGGSTILYEAAFIYNGVIIYSDILAKQQNRWHLYEVKSNIAISDTYKEDLALQYYIITHAGLPLHSASIIHLQKPLAETDLQASPSEIFITTDLTEECHQQTIKIEEHIREMQRILIQKTKPAISMGEHCNQPYTCEFKGFCSNENSTPDFGLFTDSANS